MMEILDPTGESQAAPIVYAPRPGALRGLRVGLVENTKFNSDRVLLKIGEILKAEHGVVETHLFHKHNSSVPAHEEIVRELRETCDVMVAGVGD